MTCREVCLLRRIALWPFSQVHALFLIFSICNPWCRVIPSIKEIIFNTSVFIAVKSLLLFLSFGYAELFDMISLYFKQETTLLFIGIFSSKYRSCFFLSCFLVPLAQHLEW